MRKVIVAIILVNTITLLLPIFPVFKGMIIEPDYYMGQQPPAFVYFGEIFSDYAETRSTGYLMLGIHIVCASALALLLCLLEERVRRCKDSKDTGKSEPLHQPE